jgi:hypothetical protein
VGRATALCRADTHEFFESETGDETMIFAHSRYKTLTGLEP